MAHLGAALAFPLGGDVGGVGPFGIGFFPYGPYNAGPWLTAEQMIGPLDAIPVPLANTTLGPMIATAALGAIPGVGPSGTTSHAASTNPGPSGTSGLGNSTIGPSKGS